MESEYIKRGDVQGHLKVMELLRKWDPIGVLQTPNAPKDEYDLYSADIVRLLDAGITEEQLSKHLNNIATQRMGLTRDISGDRPIARELVSYWVGWKTTA
ncbi:hypothetical protein [Opitutus sp. GAS368]|jgi:hypothetical protein|uniref:hypothetical protein n=1 Tax=Opitutus sp. GAS368 TaxID=1882749 RepID=UPI0015617A09|nr:hypothetical protein [Opitutus sp. GAS368]